MNETLLTKAEASYKKLLKLAHNSAANISSENSDLTAVINDSDAEENDESHINKMNLF